MADRSVRCFIEHRQETLHTFVFGDHIVVQEGNYCYLFDVGCFHAADYQQANQQ